jgi:hypothetical protein
MVANASRFVTATDLGPVPVPAPGLISGGYRLSLDGLTYDVRSIDGHCSEVCDECGFDGGLLGHADVVRRYQDLPEEWAVLFRQREEALLRQRPKPGVWCGFEYAHHFAVGLRWLAGILEGSEAPAGAPPAADPANHGDDCHQWSGADVIDRIAEGASVILPYARRHQAGEQPTPGAVSFGAFDLSMAVALRHGVHDSEHHVLDVRRGVATLKLARGHSALKEHHRT